MRSIIGIIPLVSVAVVLVALEVGNPAMSQSHTGRPWLELRKGIHAYTGGPGGSVLLGRAAVICDFAQAWLRSVVGRRDQQCAIKPKGLPVTIASDEIAKYDIGHESAYGVFIRADDSSWSGWTGSSQLSPDIPANTRLMVIPFELIHLAPDKNSKPEEVLAGEILDTGTIVELVSQDPKSDRYLYVTVDDGAGNIRRGWLHPENVSLLDGQGLTFELPAGYRFKIENVGSFEHGAVETNGR